MFYAAGAFTDKNPWWPVMPDVAKYLQRVSSLLRQGEPAADVALYAPTDDAWSQIRPASSRGLNLATGIRDLIGPRLIPALLDAGHTFDLFDDRTLTEATTRGYRAVVVPPVTLMPDATRRWLAERAAAGSVVIDAGGARGSPPSGSGADVSARLQTLPPDAEFDPPTPAIGFVHRRLRDADVYFLANTGNTPANVRARFGSQTEWCEGWDPMSGAIEPLEVSAATVALTFAPYGSRVVVFRGERGTATAAPVRRATQSIPLAAGWSVSVGGSAVRSPIDLPNVWSDDPRTRFFSGTASYRRTIDIPGSFNTAATRVMLDFGDGAAVEREALPGGTMRGNSFAALLAPPIREAATVFVNGRRAGVVWAPPFRVDVGPLLRDGANEIRIDVYNTAINQLAEGGRLPDTAAVTERYGQRFRLQDVDNLQPIPSGILSVPALVAYR